MAELTLVHFQPGNSVIHRLDARVKLASLVLLAVAAAGAGFGDMAVMGALIAAGFISSRISITGFGPGMLWWPAFLAVVFVSRALTAAGEPIVSFWLLTLTREGAADGLLIAGRLAAVGLMGLLLISSTRPMDIKAAVQWFLTPVPGLPAARLATMFGLIIRFIPMIFEQSRRTSAAVKARGIQGRRNPLHRIKYFALPLLRRLFEDTDNLILAMQARSYSDRRTDPRLSFEPIDWIVAAGVALTVIWIWL